MKPDSREHMKLLSITKRNNSSTWHKSILREQQSWWSTQMVSLMTPGFISVLELSNALNLSDLRSSSNILFSSESAFHISSKALYPKGTASSWPSPPLVSVRRRRLGEKARESYDHLSLSLRRLPSSKSDVRFVLPKVAASLYRLLRFRPILHAAVSSHMNIFYRERCLGSLLADFV